MEQVILVDKNDLPLGTMDKMEAHLRGELHRAFSIFIFNVKGEWLLQKRSAEKYHSPGLWTNACCSHPRQGESTEDAAKRRLKEELGIEAEVEYQFPFLYRAEFSNGLIEHEYDHVFFARYDGPFNLNKFEVEEIKFLSKDVILHQINSDPGLFTEWFKMIVQQFSDQLK